jgi:hypothetical protein
VGATAYCTRAVALFDPVWDMLLVPERFRILHLFLESVVYDGASWPATWPSCAAPSGASQASASTARSARRATCSACPSRRSPTGSIAAESRPPRK